MLYCLIHHNKNVKTNPGSALISLIERSFRAGHELRKIFNRNTIKLRYSCMLNVKQIIDGYNKAILKIAEKAQPQKDEGKTCSCRKKEDCPLNGECLVREFICLESDCLIYTMISLERVNAYVMWERPLGEIPCEGNVCGSTKHCCYKNSG